jgi:hypothetical protein
MMHGITSFANIFSEWRQLILLLTREDIYTLKLAGGVAVSICREHPVTFGRKLYKLDFMIYQSFKCVL